jgi:membrane glycosyltransferase
MTFLTRDVSASPGARTPAGIDLAADLTRRRVVVAALILTTYALLGAGMWRMCAAGGWTIVDGLMFGCYLVAAPWSVLGFWNAVIGLWLLHGPGNGARAVAGFAETAATHAPAQRTAILMTIRNEDPARAFTRFETVKRSVDLTGCGAAFDYFVLSDTTDAAVAAQEEALFADWQAREAGAPSILVYRRRENNEGFKAGNVRDFCRRWGAHYEFMLPLDADSLMTGESIVRIARIGEAWPRLGILQTLVVGMPSRSAFARIFQFGMRHGMRPYTMGSAWWAGDCGPFWGHNALVRVKPFLEHGQLPVLPGGPPLGGPIMSHDQVEATFMRRAGYEARVLPVEGGSYEENPPTLLEFTRRDLRWCQGNMQYWRLIGLPGLRPMSRFQLVWAIMMFVGIPAWTLMILLAALKPFDGEALADFPAGLAKLLYLAFLTMYLAPKLAGFLDIALTKGRIAAYGGGVRFAAGVLTELTFSFLLGAATTLRTALFMIGLLFGRSVIWSGQSRDAHALSFLTAAKGLWPQTLFGVLVIALMAKGAPAMIPWALPLVAGYVLAIPFAMLTASPALGERLARWRLCAIPEEFDTPVEIAAVQGAP